MVQAVAPVVQATVSVAASVADAATGISSMVSDVKTIFSGNASLLDKVMAGGDLLLNVAMDVSMVVGVGEGLKAAYVGMKAASHLVEEVGAHALEHEGEDAAEHALESAAEGSADQAADHAAEQTTDAAADEGDGCLAGGGGMSFAASTLVATPSGERPIASLQVGDRVEAYDPATGTTTPQTVQHTFRNHDTDLLDVTLQVTGQPAPTAAARPAPQVHTHTQDETVHTTANHPWYTADQGWLPAGFLHVGEPVVRADGRTAVVIAVRSVPGGADMCDLTVANVHTFVVGAGQFVVHNCGNEPTIYEKNAKHIFRDAKGHFLEDTPENRQALIKTAADRANFQGVDRYGNEVFARMEADGSQIWVYVRNGTEIRDGGSMRPMTYGCLTPS